MSLIRSLFLLAGIVCAVAFAYFFGHGLSTGHSGPFVMGAGLLAVGVILLGIFHRTGRSGPTAGTHR